MVVMQVLRTFEHHADVMERLWIVGGLASDQLNMLSIDVKER
jgi:hypothetical protein